MLCRPTNGGARARVSFARAAIACALTIGAARPAAPQAPLPPAHTIVGVLWQAPLTAPPAAAPAFDSARAYVALRDGTLAAIAIETGLVAWSVPEPDAFAIAAAGGDVVGIGGCDLWVRDGATGALRWQLVLDRPAVAPPVAHDALLMLALEDGSVIAVQRRDGTQRWRAAAAAPPSAPPAAADGLLFLGLPDGRVQALDAATGTVRWSQALAGRILSLTPAGDRLAAGSDDNFLYVLESGSGRMRWKWRTGGDLVGTADMDARRVYYAARDSILRAHNRSNGHLAWSRELSTRPVAGPVLLDQDLVVAGVGDEAMVYAARDGSPGPAVKLPGRPVHRPHVVPATRTRFAMTLVVTRSGHLVAVGKSVEPQIVPMAEPPGLAIPSEPEPPAIEAPLMPLADLLGSQFAVTVARRDREPALVPLAVLLGRDAPRLTIQPGQEPPAVPLADLLGSQHVADDGQPGVEPPRRSLADLLGRRPPGDL